MLRRHLSVLVLSRRLRGAAPSWAAGPIGRRSRSIARCSIARAAELATRPHALPPRPEGEGRERLTYDQYRSIRFDPAAAIWGRENRTFAVDLLVSRLHLRRAREHQSRRRRHGAARAVHERAVRVRRPTCRPSRRRASYTGYSGFRVRAPLNAPDYLDEFLVFQGASYFRARREGAALRLVGARPRRAHGAARGRGVSRTSRTSGSSGRRSKPSRSSFTRCCRARRSSARTRSRRGPATRPTVDVDATLFPRVELTAFGIAPLTSMFLFDALEPRALRRLPRRRARLRRAANRQRPRRTPVAAAREPAHVADVGVRRRQPERLRLAAAQARISRTTRTPKRSTIGGRRSGSSPRAEWGPGHVELVEIPSPREMNDNIVAYWQPRDADPGRAEPASSRIGCGSRPSRSTTRSRASSRRASGSR